MSDDEQLTRDEMLEAIRHGNRRILDDADDVYETGGNCIEVRHEARDGEVIVQLDPLHAWKLDEDGEGPTLDFHDG